MKAYTDIEQSKKLAEILPLESADMSWVSNGLGKPFARTIPLKGHPEEICGCWSLAALFEVLPNKYGRGTKTLYWFDDAWYCDYMDEDGDSVCWVIADSLIDTVYKMILKLKEKDLL